MKSNYKKTVLKLSFVLSLLFVLSSNAQIVVTQACWRISGLTSFTLGSNGAYVRQTTDGGYVTASKAYITSSNSDIYVSKMNSAGVLQWNKLISVTATSNEDVYCIQQTSDGGYVLSGVSNNHIVVVKLDASGNILWTKTINSGGSEYGYSISQTSDGGYIIGGIVLGSGQSIYVVKLDPSGNLQWTKSFGASGTNNDAFSIQQTSDGGYILGGDRSSGSPFYYQVHVMKLDASGNLQWSKEIGGSGGGYESCKSIRQTSDGGYVISGSTDSYGAGGTDVYVIKLDGSGNIQWTKTIGSSATEDSYAIQQTSDGGYIVGGSTSPSFNNADIYVVKLNSAGNLQWTRAIGSSTVSEACKSIQQTSDGGYIIGGSALNYSASIIDPYIVKLDSSGNTCCSTPVTATVGTGGIINTGGGTVTTSGTVTAATPSASTGGTLVAICTVTMNTTSIQSQSSLGNAWQFELQPNPVTGSEITLSFFSDQVNDLFFTMCDITGKQIFSYKQQTGIGSNKVNLTVNDLGKGMYFITLSDGRNQSVKKFIKE
jgi:hypothetical protein